MSETPLSSEQKAYEMPDQRALTVEEHVWLKAWCAVAQRGEFSRITQVVDDPEQIGKLCARLNGASLTKSGSDHG